MKQISKSIGIFGLAASLASGAAAWDFLYVEHAIEVTRLVEIEPLNIAGKGNITLEDDCDICPDSLPYTRETSLTTPFGSGQSIDSLGEWQGHHAMIYYSLPNPIALRIVVYSATADLSDE